MTANAIYILRSHSLPMLLEREIERVILVGGYDPGDRINEKELALRFGISRGPVREALRSLEATGLVEQIPNRGVFVRQLTAAQADDIYEVRAALFSLAGRLLAERATDDDIARLRTFVRAMDDAIRSTGPPSCRCDDPRRSMWWFRRSGPAGRPVDAPAGPR